MYEQADDDLEVLRVWECATCGQVFLNPRLSEAAVERLETSSEFYNYSPEETERTISVLGGMVESLRQLAGLERDPTALRLLDVGCNRGLLLEAGRRAGWDVTGVDISRVAIDTARERWGIEALYVGGVDSLPRDVKFDLVTCWHVLEHTFDPVVFLCTMAAHLSKGGAIAVQVPSYTYREEFIRNGATSSLFCSVHNFYFTPATLIAVAERAGLSVISILDSADDLMLTAVCRKASRFNALRRRLTLRLWP